MAAPRDSRFGDLAAEFARLDRGQGARSPEPPLLTHEPAAPRHRILARRHALATGELDLKPGGEPFALEDPKATRRTVYGLVKRRELDEMLRIHDFPDPIAHSSMRTETATPLQQLFSLNSPFILARSEALAANLTGNDDETRLREAYQRLFPARTDRTRARTRPRLPARRRFLPPTPGPPDIERIPLPRLNPMMLSGQSPLIDRRTALKRFGGGLGSLGLASALQAAGDFGSRNPLRTAGEARHPPLHERWTVWSRLFRTETRPDEVPRQRPEGADLRTERPTGGLMAVPYAYANHGRSGLPISELLRSRRAMPTNSAC